MASVIGYAGTLEERMRRKRTIDTATGCWLWHAAKDRKGYGQIRVAGKNRVATHVALELAGRPRTPDKPCALHRCDNPACVNPDHLWWGTHKENTDDARDKGRADYSGLKLGHELATANKRPLPVVDCHNCGAKFKTSKARFEKNFRNFCSRECCWDWQRAHFTGCSREEFGDCGAPRNAELVAA